jgi:hypothetical protein
MCKSVLGGIVHVESLWWRGRLDSAGSSANLGGLWDKRDRDYNEAR